MLFRKCLASHRFMISAKVNPAVYHGIPRFLQHTAVAASMPHGVIRGMGKREEK